jgi:hypothetical protein
MRHSRPEYCPALKRISIELSRVRSKFFAAYYCSIWENQCIVPAVSASDLPGRALKASKS